MKFAQTFIKHHVMTILLYILVVVFGFYSFQNLPLALMPQKYSIPQKFVAIAENQRKNSSFYTKAAYFSSTTVTPASPSP